MASTAQGTASAESRQATFERGVALSLHLWADLAFAVENGLGGADSSDKRDWFAGAVAELFPAATDVLASAKMPGDDDLLMDAEARLLQVMDDEFDTVVDDGSAYEVARQLVSLWRECVVRGRTDAVEDLRRRWEARGGKAVSGQFREGQAEDQDTDWDTEDDEEEDGEDGGDVRDVDMEETPALVPVTKAPSPEVDEDGFTKVTRKKR